MAGGEKRGDGCDTVGELTGLQTGDHTQSQEGRAGKEVSEIGGKGITGKMDGKDNREIKR